jgi:hypothetical protein
MQELPQDMMGRIGGINGRLSVNLIIVILLQNNERNFNVRHEMNDLFVYGHYQCRYLLRASNIRNRLSYTSLTALRAHQMFIKCVFILVLIGSLIFLAQKSL